MNKKGEWYYGAGALIIVVIILWVFFSGHSLPIKKESWQAVFLSNNQVYFGKLTQLKNGYFELDNVFYLQSGQNVNDSQKESTSINLIKLGSEVHGPEDNMYISEKQVLFWENLKSDSKIVKIINGY